MMNRPKNEERDLICKLNWNWNGIFVK